MKKEVPIGIKSISILFFLLAAIFLYVLMASFSLKLPDPTNYGYASNLYTILNTFFVIASVVFIMLGIFLWRLKNWARITSLILSVLVLVITLPTLIGSVALGFLPFIIIYLLIVIINIVIFFYLLLNKPVKTAFNGK